MIILFHGSGYRFFGFKLHPICNGKGVAGLHDNSGNMDDRKPLEYNSFVDFIYRKIVENKGYNSSRNSETT